MGLVGETMALVSVFLLLQYYRYGGSWAPDMPFNKAARRNLGISLTDERPNYEKFKTSI